MASRLGMQRLSRFRKTLLKNRKVTLSSGSNTSKAEGSARDGGFWHESVAYPPAYATLGCFGQTNCCARDRQPPAEVAEETHVESLSRILEAGRTALKTAFLDKQDRTLRGAYYTAVQPDSAGPKQWGFRNESSTKASIQTGSQEPQYSR